MDVRGNEALRPRRRQELEVIASAFRQTLGLIPGKIAGVWLFERLDELVIQHGRREIRVDYKVAELAWGVEACSCFNVATGKIDVVLSPATYAALHAGEPRALFTLCHECGHLVLHTEELITRATDGVDPSLNRQKTHPIYRDTEWQSDWFAGAFIAPVADIIALHDRIGFLTASDVARSFGLSKRAAAVRLHNVAKLVPEGRLQILSEL